MPDDAGAAGEISRGPGPIGPGPSDVTVVVPAHNAESTLPACLEGLSRVSNVRFALIVADDASRDATARIAEEAGAIVVRTAESPVGPGQARNLAVGAATTEFVVFVDADVIVRPETITRLLTPLREDAAVVATFGSYDDDPPARTTAALYANLRHHDVHQNGPQEAETFWAGCGAVRREAFLRVGGFSADYVRPSIEDIELGMRLRRAGGRIRLVRDAKCTHLKQWTLRQLWSTDVWSRAVPWSKLIADGAGFDAGLNLDVGQRLSAVACHIAVASLIASLLIGWPASIAAVVAVAVWGLLNRRLLGLLARRGGLSGLLYGGSLHFVYFLYSSVTFTAVSLNQFFRRSWRSNDRAATAAVVALATLPLAAGVVAATPLETLVKAAAPFDADEAAEHFSPPQVERLRIRAAAAGFFTHSLPSSSPWGRCPWRPFGGT